MDLHDDPHDSTPSNSSTAKVKTLEMIAAATLKTRFYQTYLPRQPFSFPDSLMHYIAKNPTSSKLYQKMVKSCKYFNVKYPALVNDLCYGFGKGKWANLVGRKSFALDLDNIGCKLWITESFSLRANIPVNVLQNLVSSVVPKIYRCDAKHLYIDFQAISYQDYCLLSTCAERIDFYDVTIKNEDGSITPFEKLIEASPKLQEATFLSDTTLTNITSNTVHELIKLPNFSKLKYLQLNRIPEIFNVDVFFTYIKANRFTTFDLFFFDTLSDGYKNRLEEIIDEILEAEEIDFMAPLIDFDGINAEKFEKLREIHYASREKFY